MHKLNRIQNKEVYKINIKWTVIKWHNESVVTVLPVIPQNHKVQDETTTFSSTTLATPRTSINSTLVLSLQVLVIAWCRLRVEVLNIECWPVTNSTGHLHAVNYTDVLDVKYNMQDVLCFTDKTSEGVLGQVLTL